MYRNATPSPYKSVWLLLLAFALSSAAQTTHAQIDTGLNTTVWKMLYGVTDAQANDPAWLARDDDGDGLSNGAELAAGTNPFSAVSRFAVSGATISGTNVSLTLNTAAGKLYVVQSTTNFADSSSWTALSPAVQVIGDGKAKTLVAPGGSTNTFYRVVVQDTDTDGDGVSDWAEDATGLDPANSHTHGAQTDDHTTLVADLAAETVVTIVATKGYATEPPDAATAATDAGTIMISRGGTLHFASLTVPLSWTGTAVADTDYEAMPNSVTFGPKTGVITLTLAPKANPNLRTSAVATVYALAGGTYALGTSSSASVVINPAANANGTGLTGYYFQNASTSSIGTYNATTLFAPANLKITRLDPGINFTWTTTGPGTTSTGTAMPLTYYTVRWVGQVQPQYSETYYFDTSNVAGTKSDDGLKLWVNGKLIIDSWPYTSASRVAAIDLQAGVLYDIKMEYEQATSTATAFLSWYSNSQPKQIVPTNRLYPDSTLSAPPAITSAASVVGFVGQPFTFTVTASNSANAATAYALGSRSAPLPPGLTLNATTGVISGTPTATGDFPVALTAGSTLGTGASVLDIQILSTGSGVTREIWLNGVDGSAIANIPLNAAPTTTDNALTSLEDNVVYPDNTGERLRGYFTAPVTGNYYFWLAASNAAELWISNDEEPVNKVRRAWVTAPGTASQAWTTAGQTKQRSPWLSLVAGQNYYYEILHNSGVGITTQNLAVGWLLDSTGQATTPVVTSGNGNALSNAPTRGGGGTSSANPTISAGVGGVVPGYVLYKYDYPVATAAQGLLYITNLSPQGTATSAATGSANLRMLPGNTQAVLHFNYGGLSSPRTAYHIHIAPDQTGSGPIIFDLDDVDKFHPELKTSDGGYIWNIISVGTYSAAQIVTAIQQGTTYFNVHTVNFPNGEIRGFLTIVNGSQTAPTLVADPGYTDDSATDAGAARFLSQAAHGASPTDLAAVQSGGYASWINSQMSLPATHLLDDVKAQITLTPSNFLSATPVDNAWWRAAVNSPDQLRQRVAFALSEILVVSDTNSNLGSIPTGLASYYDLLADNAFGNFRDLLKSATLHPVMGYWLNMQANQKGNITTGYHPNENYAREIMQLFSVGLNRMWPDGTFVLDSHGDLVPTYNQGTITNGFARVFTGWNWHQSLQANGQLPTSFSPSANYIDPMTMVKNYHELGTKTLLNNVALPPAVGFSLTTTAPTGSQADTTSIVYDNYCLADLDSALDNIFNDPNTGPYICRQLIQRLIESNPTPAYVNRVVQVFNDDGTSAHVRGNLAAVVRTILLDGEARNVSIAMASTTSGKQREPLLRITGLARTFPATANSGTYAGGFATDSGAAILTVTTTNPHRYSAGDVVWLDFSPNATGTPPVAPVDNPSTGGYTVLTSPAPTSTTFAVAAPDVTSIAYTQAAGSNTITVNTAGPIVGGKVYLKFTKGGGTDGVYSVVTVPTSSSFTVTTTDTAPAAAVAGEVVVLKTSGYDTITNPSGSTVSTMVLATNANTNLAVNDHVWLQWGTGRQLSDSEWVVSGVLDERRFTVTTTQKYNAETSQNLTAIFPLPLNPPLLTHSGSVKLPNGKFDMGNTNAQLVQTPLDAPTVFNFFYPDFKYPGPIAANSVTTPEFQLTTDTNIITLTNTVNSTILTSGNASGLSNFKSGSVNVDLGAFMTAPYVTVAQGNPVTAGTKVTVMTTTTVNATALINKLGDLLAGGTLTQATKDSIATFINNTTYFPLTQTFTGSTTVAPVVTSPTTCARDKARAVVQLILASPEYAVQK